jgi:DNA-binding NarL/FixJ family response regulator
MNMNVLVVDNQPLCRAGIQHTFQEDNSLKIVAEISKGNAILPLLHQLRPDILISNIILHDMDIQVMLEVFSKASAICQVIVLTERKDAASIQAALKAGVRGYIHKEDEVDTLLKAIHVVHSGKVFLSEAIVDSLAEGISHPTSGEESERLSLSPREKQVLQLMARGLTNSEIANELILNTNTIKNYVSKIYAKLDVNSRAQAVAWAWQNNRLLGLLE